MVQGSFVKYFFVTKDEDIKESTMQLCHVILYDQLKSQQ